MLNHSRNYLSCLRRFPVVALCLPVVLFAQTSPNPSAPPPNSTAPAPAPAQESQGPSILYDGVPIKFELMNKLDSRTAKAEDQIRFQVVNDVVVGGMRVLRRGTQVTGSVTTASASKTMGRAGRVAFTIDDIKLENRARVGVRAFNKSRGENYTGEMIALMASGPIVAAPFFLLIHGSNTVFDKGTQITAFVNGDVKLDPASFAPPPQPPAN
jgi:hypothetical protein